MAQVIEFQSGAKKSPAEKARAQSLTDSAVHFLKNVGADEEAKKRKALSKKAEIIQHFMCNANEAFANFPDHEAENVLRIAFSAALESRGIKARVCDCMKRKD